MAGEGLTGAALGTLGLDLLAGQLMMPVAIMHEVKIRHNIAAMQAFADSQGARLCPHGKTSMSPELFRMQLDAGAWGLSAATAHHVRIYRRLGVKRILLANQLVGKADTDFVLGEIACNPDLDFYCLIDSAEGLDVLAGAAAATACPRPVQVLIEAGIPGGRTGVRGLPEALELARRACAAGPLLALRGIETYEAIHQTRSDANIEAEAALDRAGAFAAAAAEAGLFAPGPILLSAGGSSFLDLCAARLPRVIGGTTVERVLRPGCYVTHDSGLYSRLTAGSRGRGLPELHPALEIWGVVQSVPEPGLAVANVGKRDISHDIELPIPLWIKRRGGDRGPEKADGISVEGIWDQHLRLATQPGAVSVGDMVGFGISHPCSTFDRWRAILTVDPAYRVTGAITTLF